MFWYPRTCEALVPARELLYGKVMLNATAAALTAQDHVLLDLARRAARDTYVTTWGGDEDILAAFLAAEPHPHQLIVWLLQRLGAAWAVTLTAQTHDDQWQLRIASPESWDEHFSYTYRGSLASVVARGYAGEPDDSSIEVA